MDLLKRTVFFAVLVAAFLLIIGLWKFIGFSNQPLNVPVSTVYEVKPGDSLYGVINDMHDKKIIGCKRCAQWYLRLSSKPDLVPGEYAFEKGITFKGFLDLLNRRSVLEYKITLVEGWTIQQAIEAMWKKDKLKRTLKSSRAGDLFKQLDFLPSYPGARHAEGLFFPATYTFSKGMSDVDILKQAHKKLLSVLNDEWEKKAQNLPYKNAYEALVMASIVEKETGVASEREEIAGVFVRRLNKGMLLQTDPTVIYGLGDSYKGDIKRSHLRGKTDYNTYVISGLPPTPIALAGKEAIHAALNPAAGSSLYFVATGDGGHTFSNTLREHNNAVQVYLKKLRSRR